MSENPFTAFQRTAFQNNAFQIFDDNEYACVSLIEIEDECESTEDDD